MDEGRGLQCMIRTLSTEAVMDQTTQFHYGKLVHPRPPVTVAPDQERLDPISEREICIENL